MLLSLIEFLGHFHPLIVHLPVGILLMALLLQWLSSRKKYDAFKAVVPFVLLWGSVTAFLSCISGYLLSFNDDYDSNLVSWHMYLGITVAFVSFMLYAKERNPLFGVNKRVLSVSLLLLIFITGHLGGSLTHGADYLSKPLKNIFNNQSEHNDMSIQPIANVQEAFAYEDVVKPILRSKCYACHGQNKQKGKLRMDDSLLLVKGGKDGKVIIAGKPDESDLIKRILLPVDNEDHMPPREKPQLSEQQIALIKWWIVNNNDFTKKVKELEQPAPIKPVLLALQNTAPVTSSIDDLPTQTIEKANMEVIDQLKQKGIVVLPITQNSHYLEMNFVTHPIIDTADVKLLQKIQLQIAWLNLNNSHFNDEQADALKGVSNLTRLNLSNTNITDNGIGKLITLTNLQYLNLVGTQVSLKGLTSLKALRHLRYVYLFNTRITGADWEAVRQLFPHTIIDSGGYKVPTLTTDTTLVKSKIKY